MNRCQDFNMGGNLKLLRPQRHVDRLTRHKSHNTENWKQQFHTITLTSLQTILKHPRNKMLVRHWIHQEDVLKNGQNKEMGWQICNNESKRQKFWSRNLRRICHKMVIRTLNYINNRSSALMKAIYTLYTVANLKYLLYSQRWRIEVREGFTNPFWQ